MTHTVDVSLLILKLAHEGSLDEPDWYTMTIMDRHHSIEGVLGDDEGLADFSIEDHLIEEAMAAQIQEATG